MGTCNESRNNSNPNIHQRTIRKKKEKDSEKEKEKSNEAVFPGIGNSIPNEKFKIISNQKQKSVCKIIKNGKKGTGFFCYIGEYRKIKGLITAYHVLGEEDLKIGNEIKFNFNDDIEKIRTIKIDNSRSIYANEKDDITIIEILDNDKLGNYNLLEIDDRIYDNNINYYNEYNNKIIYILHYPEGNFASFSKNIIADIDENNNIYHFCSTEGGSSGAPILNFDTLKVIGVHQAYGHFEKEKFHNEEIIKNYNYFNNNNKIMCNLGKIIKESIYNFNKENKIILILNINKDDICKKIYFLQNYDEMKTSQVENILRRIPKTKKKDIENH